MTDISIRPMETDDIPRVFEIDKASAALYWPERSYHFEVEKNENSRPFVAVDSENRILGFIIFGFLVLLLVGSLFTSSGVGDHHVWLETSSS